MDPEWDTVIDILCDGHPREIARMDAATDGVSSVCSTEIHACSQPHFAQQSAITWWSRSLKEHASLSDSFPCSGNQPLSLVSVCSGICCEAEALKVSWLKGCWKA